MRMKKFRFDPVEYQNFVDEKSANEKLKGAVHVETYTIKEKRFGDNRTLIVFAFYPDKKDEKINGI